MKSKVSEVFGTSKNESDCKKNQISEHDRLLLEDAHNNWRYEYYLASLAEKAESKEVKKQILDLEFYAFKRQEMCEDYD